MKKRIGILILTLVLAISMASTNVWAKNYPSELFQFAVQSIGNDVVVTSYGTTVIEQIACSYGENYGDDHVFGKPILAVSGNGTGTNCNSIMVALERKMGPAYFTVDTAILPLDGQAHALFSAQSVSSTATYRFVYTISNSVLTSASVTIVAVPYDYD